LDNEGDKIQVSSQVEWEEMVRQFSESHKLFKLYVTKSPVCGNERKSPVGGDGWRGGRGWGSRGSCKQWQPYNKRILYQFII